MIGEAVKVLGKESKRLGEGWEWRVLILLQVEGNTLQVPIEGNSYMQLCIGVENCQI